MLDNSFTVKFITSRNCFLALSEANIRKLSYHKIVKLHHGNKELYFSCVQSPQINDNNIVGIPNLYAKILKIHENESVFINDVLRLPILTEITISPLSFEDYEILETASDTVQSTLLDQIRVVNNKQNVVIWISKWLHASVKIDDTDPTAFGVLANLTEVHIIPPHETKTYSSSNITQNTEKNESINEKIISDNSESSAELTSLKKYLNIKKPVVFRVHPLILPPNLTGTDLIASQPCNVFIFKQDFPNFTKSGNFKDVFLCSISKVDPPLDFRDSQNEISNPKSSIIVRVCIIEEYIKLFSYNLQECFKNHSLHQKYPVMFILEKSVLNFGLSVGSKISLGHSFPFQSDITSIEVATNNKKTKNISQQFKLYVAEQVKYGKCVINSDVCIEIQPEIICSLTFTPSSEFCLFDENILRNCKIYENLDKSITYEKRTISIPLIDKKDTFVDCDSLSKIAKHAEKILCLQNSTENVFIVGKPGSGKTTMAKVICQNLSESPICTYVVYTSCKKLKGKSVESLHKLFSQDFQNLIYYQPSILVLDDLHIICGRSEAASDVQTQESLYFNRVGEMLTELIDLYQRRNKISVIATCESTMKINDNLVSPRGKHLFKNVLSIPELSKREREDILEYLFLKKGHVEEDVDFDELSVKTEGFVIQDLVDFTTKSIFESIKRNEKNDHGKPVVSVNDTETAYTNTVALALRDVRLHSPGDKDFQDVGGLEDVKKILTESMRWPAQYPGLFSNAPLRLQSGMLLYGAPGTGKTLLVAATARQCGLRLITVKGPELLSKYIGASEQAVRGIFEKAQSARPCILFFDEFDSLAPRRGHDSTGVTDRVVNQLLTQLDGVESLTGVFVIAATSRPDLLDPALLRPGRLDRQLQCSVPEQAARLAIFKALSKHLVLAEEVDLKKAALATKGFSGADIQAVLYTAQLFAVEEKLSSAKEINPSKAVITSKHLEEALRSTRPSLTKQEIQKYEKIYAKFQGKKDDNEVIKKQKATLA